MPPQSGADLAFHHRVGVGEYFTAAQGPRRPPPGIFLMFKGFLLLSKSYWTLFVPGV